MKQKTVQIGSVFEAQNGSLAKVVTFLPKNQVIVYTYHPDSANDFFYEKKLSVYHLVAGNFRSVDTPNKYGGFIGDGVYNTSCKRLTDAWNNTLKYASEKNKKLTSWLNFQNFARWYVSNSQHMDTTWQLNYNLLGSTDRLVSESSVCLLPKEICYAVKIRKANQVVKKKGSAFVINSNIYFGLSDNKKIIFLHEIDAIKMYCLLKENKVRLLAEKYKQQLPDHVYQALKFWNCCLDFIQYYLTFILGW